MIQPSYGNAAARRHWYDTLDGEVDFTNAAVRSSLSDNEFQRLMAYHPTGSARFWGTTAGHDARIDELSTGDVVLFTGQKIVRAIGELGVILRNPALGRALWTDDPTRGVYSNVYSLRAFEPSVLPYTVLQEAIGSSAGDNFQSLRLVRDNVDEVLDVLGIETITGDEVEAAEATETLKSLGEAYALDQILPPEENVLLSGSYASSRREVTFRRVESVLVNAYRAALPNEAQAHSIRCASGRTDLYVSLDGSYDLIEAKGASTHRKVRECLGQILDYAHATTRPVSTLTALFPSVPTATDVALLHAYGIDVLFATSNGAFERRAATQASHDRWKK